MTKVISNKIKVITVLIFSIASIFVIHQIQKQKTDRSHSIESLRKKNLLKAHSLHSDPTEIKDAFLESLSKQLQVEIQEDIGSLKSKKITLLIPLSVSKKHKPLELEILNRWRTFFESISLSFKVEKISKCNQDEIFILPFEDLNGFEKKSIIQCLLNNTPFIMSAKNAKEFENHIQTSSARIANLFSGAQAPDHDPSSKNASLLAKLRWVARIPSIRIATWPNNKKNITLISASLNEQTKNPKSLVEFFHLNKITPTYFVVSNFYLNHPGLLGEETEKMEIESQAETSWPLNGQDLKTQFIRIQTSRFEIEEKSLRPVVGLMPPNGLVDANTLIAAKENHLLWISAPAAAHRETPIWLAQGNILLFSPGAMNLSHFSIPDESKLKQILNNNDSWVTHYSDAFHWWKTRSLLEVKVTPEGLTQKVFIKNHSQEALINAVLLIDSGTKLSEIALPKLDPGDQKSLTISF